MSVPALSRRGFFSASGFAVVSAVVGYVVARHSAAAQTRPGTAAANAYGPAPAHAAQVLTTLSSIPAGGEVVGGVVLTRSATGDVRAVSATCTHQGCTVGQPNNGIVTCPCHGSQFDAVSGAVRRGPASRPLPAVAVAVQGDQVVRT